MASTPSSLGGYLGGLGGTINRLGQELDVGLQQAALNLGQALRGTNAPGSTATPQPTQRPREVQGLDLKQRIPFGLEI